MATSELGSLDELLRALGRERDLRGRMRVLARGWKLLRSLSPAQREQVALRVGSRWAWRRIERAFLRDGELDEGEQWIGDAFERMGESDPRELRRIARQIREGDGRAAKDLLLMTLTEALEEEAGEQELQDWNGEPAPATDLPSEPDAAPATDLSSEPDAAPDRKPRVEIGSRAGKPEPSDSPVDASLPREPEVVETAREVLASSRAQRVTAREPVLAPWPPPSPQPIAPPTPSLRLENESAPLVPRGGAERLRTLRELQRSRHPGADLGRAERGRLLDALGGGWASRRALSRMISARSLDDLDEALDHVEHLLRPGQKIWCLADLLAHWPLQPAEVERVLAAAPSDAARRRLRRRAAG